MQGGGAEKMEANLFSWDFYGISLGFLEIVYGMLIGLFNFGNLIEMIGFDWDLSWEDF
jgi:hypothetical protein